MKKKVFYCLSILLLILLLGIACHSESDDDDDTDVDDDDGSDDDDIADDDDDGTPEPLPYTYGNLEFETIATTDGYFIAQDFALNSEGKAGICLIESAGFEIRKYYFGMEQDNGDINMEELDEQLESDCAITFDEQDRPVILFVDNLPGDGVESKMIRRESDGHWTEWALGAVEGTGNVVGASPTGPNSQFIIGGVLQQVGNIEDSGWEIISYTGQLSRGDAFWGCDGIFMTGVRVHDLIYSFIDANGSWSVQKLDEFITGEKEDRWISIANTSACEPRILVSVNEDPPPSDTKKNEETLKRSLRLYKKNSADVWEYGFVATNLNGNHTDMLIDPFDTLYIAMPYWETTELDQGALSLAVGTWEDFEIIPLYDITAIGEITMKADPENRLHFLFTKDSQENLVYGRPALD